MLSRIDRHFGFISQRWFSLLLSETISCKKMASLYNRYLTQTHCLSCLIYLVRKGFTFQPAYYPFTHSHCHTQRILLYLTRAFWICHPWATSLFPYASLIILTYYTFFLKQFWFCFGLFCFLSPSMLRKIGVCREFYFSCRRLLFLYYIQGKREEHFHTIMVGIRRLLQYIN